MLADQLEWSNLNLATALAPKVDDFSSAEIIERRIGAIDETSGHHSLDVECGGAGGCLSHRVSRMRSTMAVARNDGRRQSNFGPRCRRRTSLAAQAIGHSGVCGAGYRVAIGDRERRHIMVSIDHAPYENKNGTMRKTPTVERARAARRYDCRPQEMLLILKIESNRIRPVIRI
jgi:hypothetical protein